MTETPTMRNTLLATPASAPLHGVDDARRPVVLLRRPKTAHRFARDRAMQLAAALHTEVLEVRLIDDGAEDSRTLERLLQARQRWARRFGDHLALPPLVTLPNEGTGRLARSLGELGAQVVVLSSVRVWPGDSVVTLAAESGVPCVVARQPRPEHALLVASSLLDPRLPLVNEAAAWAKALERPLTLHHHVEPDIVRAERPDLESKVERLAASRGADVALTHGFDPVSGILAVARSSDADVIVVGASGALSDASRRVAPRVAATAQRSVMVVPMSA